MRGRDQPTPSTDHAVSLASRRNRPGLLIFRPPMTLLYREPWLWERYQEIGGLESGEAKEGRLLPALTHLCAEVSALLHVRTEPKDWEQFRVRRVVSHQQGTVLMSALGVPQPQQLHLSHIVVIIEELGRCRDGLLEQAKQVFHLSEREAAVVAQILKGWTNRQIALALHITEQTVKEHIKHIMQKTGTKTRAGVLLQVFR